MNRVQLFPGRSSLFVVVVHNSLLERFIKPFFFVSASESRLGQKHNLVKPTKLLIQEKSWVGFMEPNVINNIVLRDRV